MLTLGIDTSTEIGAIGLVKKEKFLGETNILLNQRHSERIMVNIDYILGETQYKVNDLEVLAVTIGPGSFTGLRIGVTTARTMAQFLEIPIVGISTLDGLVYNLLSAEKNWILPVIDASRERVYTSLYKVNRNCSNTAESSKRKNTDKSKNYRATNIEKMRIWEEETLPLDELFTRLKKEVGDNLIYVTGNGVNNYFEKFKESKLNFEFYPVFQNSPRGSVIAHLGYQLFKNGQKDNIYEVTPNYLNKAPAAYN